MQNLGTAARYLLTTLAGAVIALCVRYGESWFHNSVETEVPGQVLTSGPSGFASVSRSPARTLRRDGSVEWQIAFVTNRQHSAIGSLDGSGGLSTVSVSAGAELDAVMESMSIAETLDSLRWYVPATTYADYAIDLPRGRRRGECCLDAKRPGHVVLRDPIAMERERFYGTILELVAAADAPDVLVFIHGFNVSQEEAAARAAQMAEDMPFHGVMVAFSWPSAARTSGYAIDSAMAERYFWNLADMLAELRTRLPEKARIHVLAHSMGNRVTLRALAALTGLLDPTGGDLVLNPQAIVAQFPHWGAWSEQRLTTAPLATLIFAAPDVPAGQFEFFTDRVRHVADSMVLYSSDSDFALEGSLRVNHEGYRAGDSRANIRVDGLRTIHVSGVSTRDPLGHSYYGSNPAVLSQLARLLAAPRLSPDATIAETAVLNNVTR